MNGQAVATGIVVWATNDASERTTEARKGSRSLMRMDVPETETEAITTTAHGTELALQRPLPADQHPVAVYLASLAPGLWRTKAGLPLGRPDPQHRVRHETVVGNSERYVAASIPRSEFFSPPANAVGVQLGLSEAPATVDGLAVRQWTGSSYGREEKWR